MRQIIHLEKYKCNSFFLIRREMTPSPSNSDLKYQRISMFLRGIFIQFTEIRIPHT